MSMKKLYSKIALALLAAGISFTASALDVATSMTEWTLEPVDGAEVEMLDVIYVHFPNPADGVECGIIPSNAGNYITLTCGETVYRAVNARAGKGGDYSYGMVEFDPITVPGVYTLRIANGVFYDYEMAETSDNENDPYPTHHDITATYVVTAADVPSNPMLEFESDPFDGSVVEEISVIEMAFPDAAEGIELAGTIDDINLLSGTLFVAEVTAADIDAEAVTITLSETVTEPGVYTLVIPEGTFKAVGTDFVNEEILLDIEIEGEIVIGENKMNVYAVDPADGSTVDKLDRIDISFTEVADGIDQYGSFNALTITRDGAPVTLPYQMIIGGSNYEVLSIVFNEPVTEAGEYVITVPAETVRDYTTSGDEVHTNPEIVLHYTVSLGSGVSSIEAVSGDSTVVYDLSGRAMRADRLDAGLYIMNGKKIVIRK